MQRREAVVSKEKCLWLLTTCTDPFSVHKLFSKACYKLNSRSYPESLAFLESSPPQLTISVLNLHFLACWISWIWPQSWLQGLFVPQLDLGMLNCLLWAYQWYSLCYLACVSPFYLFYLCSPLFSLLGCLFELWPSNWAKSSTVKLIRLQLAY